MDNRQIGVFDSGVGGLTVLQYLHQALPEESFIYVGDNAHSPYGEKKADQLLTYTIDIVNFFIQKDVKLIVLACNTTSCTVLEQLRTRFTEVPMIGVIDATCKTVLESNCQNVVIMATQATIQSHAYQQRLSERNAIGLACPPLVPMIENGYQPEAMKTTLHQLLDKPTKEADSIVLGCTHYPIIAGEIQELYPQLKLFSSSQAVVKEVTSYLNRNKLNAKDQDTPSLVYTTGDLTAFKRSSQQFFDDHDFNILSLDLKVA